MLNYCEDKDWWRYAPHGERVEMRTSFLYREGREEEKER